MIGLIDRLSRPLLRVLDPEDAHALTLKALRHVPLPRAEPDPPALSVRAFGLTFPNPVGVAPGFDKNAQAPDALLRLGQSLAALGEKEAACASLGEVLRKYPRAPLSVKQSVDREQKRTHC